MVFTHHETIWDLGSLDEMKSYTYGPHIVASKTVLLFYLR